MTNGEVALSSKMKPLEPKLPPQGWEDYLFGICTIVEEKPILGRQKHLHKMTAPKVKYFLVKTYVFMLGYDI